MAPAQQCAGVFFKNRARQVCRARSNSHKPIQKPKMRPAFMAGRRIYRHSGPYRACACDALAQIEPPPRWAGAGVRCTLLRQVVQMRAVHDADGWPLATSQSTVHRHAAQPCHEGSTTRLNPFSVWCREHSRQSLWARPCQHQGACRAACLRGCRVDHHSIRASSTPASLACRES